MKLYELKVDGYHTPFTADQIADHFSRGLLRKSDPCREVGSKQWQTIDELFPLLKYDSTGRSVPTRSTRPTPSMPTRSLPQDRPVTSALKAGWVCFGLGVAVSWFFPLANVFFSIAAITAVVAMCSHQVNRGLILLLSTLCAIAMCAFIFFALVVGTIGAVAVPAITKADSDLKTMRQAHLRGTSRLNSSLQQMQPTPPNWPIPQSGRFPAPSSSLTSARQSHAIANANAADGQVQEDKARTREAVRLAEQQRDRIDAKQKRIEQLQKDIDTYDHTIQQIRNTGGDTRYWEDKRDELLRQKWDLQR